jgi:hypothetical protein
MTLLTQDDVDLLHETEQLLVRRQMNPHLNNETFWALERIRLHIIREIQEDETALATVFATRDAQQHRIQQERWARKAHLLTIVSH